MPFALRKVLQTRLVGRELSSVERADCGSAFGGGGVRAGKVPEGVSPHGPSEAHVYVFIYKKTRKRDL